MLFVYTLWKYVYNQSLGAILKTKRICLLFKGMLCKKVGRIPLLPFSPTQRRLDSAAIWGINISHLCDEVVPELNQSAEIYFLFILFVSSALPVRSWYCSWVLPLGWGLHFNSPAVTSWTSAFEVEYYMGQQRTSHSSWCFRNPSPQPQLTQPLDSWRAEELKTCVWCFVNQPWLDLTSCPPWVMCLSGSWIRDHPHPVNWPCQRLREQLSMELITDWQILVAKKTKIY